MTGIWEHGVARVVGTRDRAVGRALEVGESSPVKKGRVYTSKGWGCQKTIRAQMPKHVPVSILVNAEACRPSC